jgi:N-acylglucosamine 2-epimerase
MFSGSQKDLLLLKNIYKNELLENCVPFWLNNSVDMEYGGYLSFLDRKGKPYANWKYCWPQGRGSYMFSKLYNTIEKKEEWLRASKSGIDFITKYIIRKDLRVHNKLTREGQLVNRLPAEIFGEAFVALGLVEYAGAAGKEEYLSKGKEIFWNSIKIIENGTLDKLSNDLSSQYIWHGPSMILMNVAQEMREIEDDSKLTKLIAKYVQDELYTYTKDEYKIMFERVRPDGSVDMDNPEGRSVTPGHCLESAWFCLREGLALSDQKIIDRSCDLIEWTMEMCWDNKHGGLYNFLDYKGLPPGHHDEGWGENMDWDEKLFWVHSEGLYAILLAYSVNKDNKFLQLFEKLHRWTFEHFPDREYGEWYGYLRRDGSISQDLKGGIKAFFHIPRALLNCYLLLNKMTQVE